MHSVSHWGSIFYSSQPYPPTSCIPEPTNIFIYNILFPVMENLKYIWVFRVFVAKYNGKNGKLEEKINEIDNVNNNNDPDDDKKMNSI